MKHRIDLAQAAQSGGDKQPHKGAIARLEQELDIESIRIGLGKSNTAEHIGMLVDDLKRIVAKLREISAA